MDDRSLIQEGRTAIGIELGSTRIKAVLVDEDARLLAAGFSEWENRYENGLWTYSLDDAVKVLQKCFAELKKDVRNRFGIDLITTGTLGISAMMHGYIALDENGCQLCPFLTWRNVNTAEAAEELTEALQFNMPLRWSVSQLYQAVLEKKDHVNRLKYLCTLSAYIHFLLSGEKKIGVGDASGMFPIDPETCDYDEEKLHIFEKALRDKGCPLKLRTILPEVLTAGSFAGKLTEKGALILDPTGKFEAGVPMVPPEGDAGTGMTATNAVAVRTGNVSAGTSIFSMTVLEQPLRKWHRNVDIVMTPDGKEVAMIQCNNGAPDLDAWMRLIQEIVNVLGVEISTESLYETFFNKSLEGSLDADGIVNINYLAGEHVAGIEHGHPMFIRNPESEFSMANFAKSMIYSIFATLSIGMRVLRDENVRIDRMTGHGGLFKTEGIAQRYLSAAIDVPIGVLKTAGEGGAFGMAMLALYRKKALQGISLPEFLDSVFKGQNITVIEAGYEEKEGFKKFLFAYERALKAEESIAD